MSDVRLYYIYWSYFWIFYPLIHITLYVEYIMFVIQSLTLVLYGDLTCKYTSGMTILRLSYWTYAWMDFSFAKPYATV